MPWVIWVLSSFEGVTEWWKPPKSQRHVRIWNRIWVIHPTVQVISSFSETIALMQEEHADRAAKEVIEKG